MVGSVLSEDLGQDRLVPLCLLTQIETKPRGTVFALKKMQRETVGTLSWLPLTKVGCYPGWISRHIPSWGNKS